jgi:NADPH:quinone reductase-like Zn-dependent oxidoreductase
MGAAGALGSAAVALAKHRGAVVIGVDRLAGRSHILDHLPLDAAFDGEDPELAEKILEFTDGWGVDCVVDNLGLSGLWENYRPALATLGRIVISGAIGRDPIPMQLLPFYLHSQSLLGVRTGNPGHMRGLWSEVADGFRLPAGAVSTTSWERMRDAHADVEAGRAAGQTVLEVHP